MIGNRVSVFRPVLWGVRLFVHFRCPLITSILVFTARSTSALVGVETLVVTFLRRRYSRAYARVGGVAFLLLLSVA
jgi:hypothetical protein